MLSADIRYNFEQGNTTNREYNSLETYSTRNLINRFTQIDGDETTYIVPLGGVLTEGFGRLSAHSARGQLNFGNERHNSKHRIVALLGAEIRATRRQNSSSRTYGYDADILTHQVVDYVNRYPIFDNLASNAVIPSGVSYSGLDDRYLSTYAN